MKPADRERKLCAPATESLVASGPFSALLADHFDGYTGVSRELLEFLCGERLGYGMSREVFVWRLDPRYVLKIELTQHTFQNVSEVETWQTVEHCPEHAKWFAPVKAISGCGRFMLQRRAEPVASIALPAEVPAYFTDLKPTNFGCIGKNFVAVDYGRTLLQTVGLTKRMKKADWS
jgi:hypothetical protein